MVMKRPFLPADSDAFCSICMRLEVPSSPLTDAPNSIACLHGKLRPSAIVHELTTRIPSFCFANFSKVAHLLS